MRVLLYVLGIIFIPLPAFQHFVWPLSNCLLADFCNHTWVPECGAENVSGFIDYRLFIDECDMFEYNCDNERTYEVATYALCYQPATGCPTLKPKSFFRMGNYRFVLEGRRLIYDPTSPTTKGAPPIPLPSRMLHGKRRHTPEARKRNNRFQRLGLSSPCGGCGGTRGVTIHTRKTMKRKTSKTSDILKKSIPMTKSSMVTTSMTKPPNFRAVYKRLTVIKDGRVMVKVVKGVGTTVPVLSEDSDFIQ